MAEELYEINMEKQKLSADDAGLLILFTAILVGTWFRIMPAWMAGFPINDGGMFYTMIQNLQVNHYIPPLYTTYNNLNIPFAYPPLGLYLGAVLGDLFNLASPLPVIQWLPGIINAFCIPAFYLLAREILGDKLQSAISTLVFALIPHMTAWFSMGGGLTRALGALFMLLALKYIHGAFAKEGKKDIWGAIIFSSLAALSHTEAPVYIIAIAIYIWAMKSRSQKGLLNGVLIAIGVFILSIPWYGWVVYQHGVAPLILASQAGFHSIWSVLRLINIDFVTEEPYLDVLGVLGILGVATLVARRTFFIPGMLIVVYLSQPRSAHTIANIPLAMAAGFFIAEILIPAMTRIHENGRKINSRIRPGLTFFFIILIPYWLSNSVYYGFQLSEMHVSKAGRGAMQWVANNTPKESKFLVITGEPSGFCDSTSEWFPALTNRQSIATLQGNEWLQGQIFGQYVGYIQNLQTCSKKGLACLLQEAEHFGSNFDYLYLSLNSPTSNCNLTDASGLNRGLILELDNSVQFQTVFRSDEVLIFSKR